MRRIDAGVNYTDDDSLAVVGVSPQPGIPLEPKKFLSVGGGAPELVWKRPHKLCPLGHEGGQSQLLCPC